MRVGWEHGPTSLLKPFRPKLLSPNHSKPETPKPETPKPLLRGSWLAANGVISWVAVSMTHVGGTSSPTSSL